MKPFNVTPFLRCTSVAVLAGSAPLLLADEPLPIFDAHVHYSHDSVELTPPERVIELMKQAGLKGALVSSSDDKGTQLLTNLAPGLVIPGLRPYRRRGELSTWFRDEKALAYVEERLAKHRYASIGEFHLSGADADLPIPRRIVALAAEHNLILHAHSDADAVARLFAHDPNVKILWAHSGFDSPESVSKMLERFPNLWADLAFRSDMGSDGAVDPGWRKVFEAFPKRMMLGTDTFTPERIYYVPEHASESRKWLAALPQELRERVAWRNAVELLVPVWRKNRGSAAAKKPGETSALNCDKQRASRTDRVLPGKSARLLIRALGPIRVSRPFSMQVALCDLKPNAVVTGLTVDATMPAHGHGMNYQPPAQRLGANAPTPLYQVDGLVLHMPGEWQWQLTLRSEQGTETFTTDMLLE